MDNLPLIPAMKITDYLSIKDILNLRMVNKWFYQIINENVKIKELVISTHVDSPYNRRWFYTYDLISPQNLIKYDADLDDSIRSDQPSLNLNKPILDQLKQLYLYFTRITLETLNSLDRLVHLEIVYSKIMNITENNVLRLPMLEILNLYWSGYDNKILIDSTKLQRLKLHRNSVELVHPESITYLEVEYYNCCKKFLPSCTNLEHFYCCGLDSDLDSFNLNEFNLIKNLPKLKSIHFDQPKETFVSLINEKKRLNKDLEIYFSNFKFDELPDELPNELPAERSDGYIDELLEDHLHSYYAKHYSRLADNCPFVESINYSLLEIYFDKIPVNFMKRFVDLTEFIVKKNINNLDQLIRVLEECKTITSLELHSSLGQHFFDFHLYDQCPNIRKLEICDARLLNFEFIFKFKSINEFCVSHLESIEFARRLVESRKYITVEFNYFRNRNEFKIRIEKYRSGYFYLTIEKRFKDPLVFRSLDDLYKLESYLDTANFTSEGGY